MTETIQQLKEDIAVLQEKLNKLEAIEKQPKMTLENEGEFSIVYYDGTIYYRLQFPDGFCDWYRRTMIDRTLSYIDDIKTKNELESRWLINDVKSQNDDEVEQDEKDNSKPMDEVVNRLVEKYQAQKLWNIMKDKWEFSEAECNDIVEGVEEWLPKPQSAAGSQNVNTELLVEGFNDCVRKMKEMLR